MPYYLLAVEDGQGQAVPFGFCCGMYSVPTDATNSLVIILPGETHQQLLYHCRDIRSSGTFTLQFHYVFDLRIDPSKGVDYPAGLWHGEAVSNVIKAQLDPN